MDRKTLILTTVVAVFGIAATAAYAFPSKLGTHATRASHTRAHDAGDISVVGAWHVTVNVDGSPTSFDTLYLFNRDGGFMRIDGRNNVPGLGVWEQSTQDRVISTFVLFSFDATGHRTGTITANTLGQVRDGVLTGSFTATGIDPAGQPLPGFPKTGTFTGDRIEAQAP